MVAEVERVLSNRRRVHKGRQGGKWGTAGGDRTAGFAGSSNTSANRMSSVCLQDHKLKDLMSVSHGQAQHCSLGFTSSARAA